MPSHTKAGLLGLQELLGQKITVGSLRRSATMAADQVQVHLMIWHMLDMRV